jgi:putative sugar O-methyltransferase
VQTAIASHTEVSQVEDDLKLLYRMLSDAKKAAAIWQPTHYWAAYESRAIAALQSGLHDFRRNPDSIFATFGALDSPPAMLETLSIPPDHGEYVTALVMRLNQLLADGAPLLPFGLSMRDIFELAYAFCQAQARDCRRGTLVSIDELDVSRVGNPHGYEHDGRFLTDAALYYYMRYAFVAGAVDLNTVDVVVELGSGSGKQVEVLKRLHPHLTFVLADLAPQLYVAERFLHAVFPDDCVSYDATRAAGRVEIRPGKIHFVGNARVEDLEPDGRVLFWNCASFGEMEPDVVARYANVVSPWADWLYLCQCFEGKERAADGLQGGVVEPVVWDHYLSAFASHRPLARRAAHTGYAPLVEGACEYEDTFWVRRDS